MNQQPNPADTIRRFIERERAMRLHVFRNQPTKRRKKLDEADAALLALDQLASQSGWEPVFHGRVDAHLHIDDGALVFEDELGEARGADPRRLRHLLPPPP